MTEDDTFRVLKRTPYDQLMDEMPDDHFAIRPKALETFVNEHGWTLEEYISIRYEKLHYRSVYPEMDKELYIRATIIYYRE